MGKYIKKINELHRVVRALHKLIVEIGFLLWVIRFIIENVF